MSVVRKTMQFLIPVATLAVLVSSSPVMAAPWLSGPSAIVTGERAVLSGGGMPANDVVAIVVTLPDGRLLTTSEIIDPDGKLVFDVPISIAGHYRVDIATMAGQPLSSASVTVNP